MSPENVQVSRRAGALAAAMNARRVQRARLRTADSSVHTADRSGKTQRGGEIFQKC